MSSSNCLIGGVDEAGRGCLAGPVVASCVVLPQIVIPPFIKDSKKLSAAQRAVACQWVFENALSVGIGLADVAEIEQINILQAAMLAMRRAVEKCDPQPTELRIDGNKLPRGLTIPAVCIVGGDDLDAAISAASIVAKVTRDLLMVRLDKIYPGYELAKHKGYATKLHREAIMRLGLTVIHRRSFCGFLQQLELDFDGST
ncbi:MAG: ribonuclease HII [Armatimonadota bacterium]